MQRNSAATYAEVLLTTKTSDDDMHLEAYGHIPKSPHCDFKKITFFAYSPTTNHVRIRMECQKCSSFWMEISFDYAFDKNMKFEAHGSLGDGPGLHNGIVLLEQVAQEFFVIKVTYPKVAAFYVHVVVPFKQLVNFVDKEKNRAC